MRELLLHEIVDRESLYIESLRHLGRKKDILICTYC